MTYQPVQAPFLRADSTNYGGTQDPGLNVIHGTVSPCVPGGARAVAQYFKQPGHKTSSQYIIDPKEIIQSVSDHRVAYHCGYNHDSLAYEMCMFPKHDLTDWLQKDYDKKYSHSPGAVKLSWLTPNFHAMLGLTAKAVATNSLAYGIPIRWLGVEGVLKWDLHDRNPAYGGITSHAVMSKAFKLSSHWDPGFWPRPLFMRRVHYWYDRLK